MTQPIASRRQSFVLSGNPALLFVVTTAMATTVATAISTVLWSSRAAEPVACACTCEHEHATEPPVAEPVAMTRSGAGHLEREAIRAVVTEHIGDIRECYNAGLQRDPALAGRVAIAFTIAPDGDTETVRSESSTLPSQEVVDCIVRAVDGWSFPAPTGGEVEVVYPFVLEPG